MAHIALIAELILNKNRKETSTGIGFLNGRMGEIYFLYYYSLLDEKYENCADTLLQKLLSDLLRYDKNIAYTYCNGLAGIGSSLHILEKSGFLQLSADIFEEINIILESMISKEIANKNYDFLHGVIGIGVYFLKHYQINPKTSLVQIKRILEYLENTAIIDTESNSLKWGKFGETTIEYNISLSHGMSSIIIFLSEVIKIENIEIDKVKVSKMLDMALNYIQYQKLDHIIYGCYFPYTSKESVKSIAKSRLAWCYGDLGVAMTLWMVGNSLNREDIINLSIKILSYNATRKDLKSNLVMDASLCHGTAGIAQIFFRMHKNTELQLFQDAYEYWNKQTLKMSYHKSGLAGYMSYNIIQDQWYNTTSLLEGISGIGLSLLSPICSDWDEALLLNF